MEFITLDQIPRAYLGFAFIVGLFAPMVAIPLLVKAAGRHFLLDKPNERSMHGIPIPKVGGIGIALGVLLPLLIWTSLEPPVFGYIVASVIILIGGIWDDVFPLNYWWKLTFQAIAVAIVIQEGVLITHVPFFGFDPVSVWISYPLTFIFLLGITNATNLFDGLDGLAGGCILFSFGAIATLAYMGASNTFVVLVALATIGGILAFLRYNTHPALVFMGDAGSQFLGFTAAVLAILLTEKIHPALNPALLLLIFGIPILDTVMVIVLRLKQGRSPFLADQQHIHHQLISIGFRPYEAVAMLYFLHAIMVGAALFLKYQSDFVVCGVYVGLCANTIGLIYLAKAKGFTLDTVSGDDVSVQMGWRERSSARLQTLSWFAERYIEYSLAALFFAVGSYSSFASPDFAILGFGGAGALLFGTLFLRKWATVFSRIAIYSACFLSIYISAGVFKEYHWIYIIANAYLVSLIASAIFVLIFGPQESYDLTPQYFLILIFAIAIPSFSREFQANVLYAGEALRVMILIYVSELIVSSQPNKHWVLRLSAFLALVLVGARAVWAL